MNYTLAFGIFFLVLFFTGLSGFNSIKSRWEKLIVIVLGFVAIIFFINVFVQYNREKQEFYQRYICYMEENYDNVEYIKYEQTSKENCSIEHRAGQFRMQTYCYINDDKYYIVFEERIINYQLENHIYSYNVYLQQIEN